MASYYSLTLVSTPNSPHRGEIFYCLKLPARKCAAKTAWRCSNFTVRVWRFVRNIHKFAYQHPYYTFIKYLYIIQITDAFAPLWRFFPWLNITCLIKYIYKSQSYWLGWSKDPGPPKAGMFPAIFIVGDASCGQIELTKIFSSVFNAMLPKIEFRKVLPSEFILFQVADLLCSFCLIDLKLSHGCCLSHSELTFFGNLRDLKKNYLKPIKKKEWLWISTPCSPYRGEFFIYLSSGAKGCR